MEENVKSFLEKIQEIKDATVPIHVVSSGKEGQSKPLSFKQQKDLISTITDGTIGALKFQMFLNQIVLANTGDDYLKTIDKLPIILKLRYDAIGDTVKVGDTTVPLIKVIDKINKLKFTQSEVVKGDIQLILEVPTLKEENKVIQACIATLKSASGAEELGRSIGDIYTYEIVKYVKSISFSGDTLDFNELPIKDRVKVIENLPISTNKKIVDFIQKIKKKETDLLTVNIDGQDKIIELDVRFFDT